MAVNNQEHKDQQIFVNEDLTSRRSKLANETRQMKSSKKITDCWTYNGKVLVKDLSNRIKEITCPRDLQNISVLCAGYVIAHMCATLVA